MELATVEGIDDKDHHQSLTTLLSVAIARQVARQLCASGPLIEEYLQTYSGQAERMPHTAEISLSATAIATATTATEATGTRIPAAGSAAAAAAPNTAAAWHPTTSRILPIAPTAPSEAHHEDVGEVVMQTPPATPLFSGEDTDTTDTAVAGTEGISSPRVLVESSEPEDDGEWQPPKRALRAAAATARIAAAAAATTATAPEQTVTANGDAAAGTNALVVND